MNITQEQKQTIRETWDEVNSARSRSLTPAIGLIGILIMFVGLVLGMKQVLPTYVCYAIDIIGFLCIVPVEVIRFRARKTVFQGILKIEDITRDVLSEENNPSLSPPFPDNVGSRATVSFRSDADPDDINDIVAVSLGNRYFKNIIYKDEQAWLYIARYNEPMRLMRVSADEGAVAIQAWLVDAKGRELNLAGQTAKQFKNAHNTLMEYLRDRIVNFDGTIEE